MKKKKVLQVIGYLGVGGDSVAVFNILDFIEVNNLDIEFEFVTHLGEKNESVVLKTISELKKRGIKVNTLDGDVRRLGPFKYYKEIKKIMSSGNYDSIHVHTSFQGIISILAAKRCNIKQRICHAHTTKVQRKVNKILLLGLPICRFFINKYSTHFIGCGVDAANYLFGKNKNVSIIHNGVKVNTFINENKNKSEEIRKIYNIKKDNLIVGSVGRICEMKNQKFILQLAERTINNRNIVYMIVGDGEDFVNIKETIKSRSLNNVILTGRKENINEYMHIFDYFVLPSIYGEGLPVVLIEAQLARCKCLVSDTVTRECNIGNIEFLNLKEVDKWVNKIDRKKEFIKNINVSKFDIENTALDWVDIYYEKE